MILKDPGMEIPRTADCFVGFDKCAVVVKDQLVFSDRIKDHLIDHFDPASPLSFS